MRFILVIFVLIYLSLGSINGQNECVYVNCNCTAVNSQAYIVKCISFIQRNPNFKIGSNYVFNIDIYAQTLNNQNDLFKDMQIQSLRLFNLNGSVLDSFLFRGIKKIDEIIFTESQGTNYFQPGVFGPLNSSSLSSLRFYNFKLTTDQMVVIQNEIKFLNMLTYIQLDRVGVNSFLFDFSYVSDSFYALKFTYNNQTRIDSNSFRNLKRSNMQNFF